MMTGSSLIEFAPDDLSLCWLNDNWGFTVIEEKLRAGPCNQAWLAVKSPTTSHGGKNRWTNHRSE